MTRVSVLRVIINTCGTALGINPSTSLIVVLEEKTNAKNQGQDEGGKGRKKNLKQKPFDTRETHK
jgi:hypothetical protein